jgi:hypothetical protein
MCGTWLYELSGDANLSQGMLGHTTVATTEKHYIAKQSFLASKRANQLMPEILDTKSGNFLVSNL